MRKLRVIALSFLMSALSTYIADAGISLGSYTYDCKTDGEIPQLLRDTIDKVAMDFVAATQSSHPETTFTMLAADVQKTTSAQKLAAEFASHIDQSDP